LATALLAARGNKPNPLREIHPFLPLATGFDAGVFTPALGLGFKILSIGFKVLILRGVWGEGLKKSVLELVTGFLVLGLDFIFQQSRARAHPRARA
jgi:hypothetical protein